MPIDVFEVEYTYLLLEENFGTLYQCCLSVDQKKHLCDLYSAARYACWKAVEQARRDERAVDSIVSRDLKMTNLQLATILQNLGDIGACLTLAAEAVRLASSVAPAPIDT
jgi:hypothetical protein